jgi:hypothetical protein
MALALPSEPSGVCKFRIVSVEGGQRWGAGNQRITLSNQLIKPFAINPAAGRRQNQARPICIDCEAIARVRFS